MLRKSLLLFALICFTLPISYAEPEEIHAGTPAGFYDDINPDDLEKEDDEEYNNAQTYHTFTDNDTEDNILVPPAQKTKATKNYAQIYNDLEVPTFSYLHDIDPDQYYDTKDTSWSIYPLLRLISPIYFKSITIEPGYYLLTPREHQGKWYLLFKQNGVVKHIIPVYDRDYTPETFYKEHIPQPKLTPSQKIHMGFLDLIGNINSTKRKKPVESYLEVNDVENYFVSIIIYYGSHKYSTIFRTIKL